MRIVATSDTHYPPFVKRFDQHLNPRWEPTIPIPDGDVFVHAGDIMRTGYPDEWNSTLEWLALLPHKTKIYVPGNHDFHIQLYPGPALQQLRQVGVTCVGLPGNDNFTSVLLPNGMRLLGLPYVIDLERWAMSISEQHLISHLNKVWPVETSVKHDIVVSHAPVKTVLDNTVRGAAGLKPYLDHLLRLGVASNPYSQFPKVWISGHIHEGYGHTSFAGIDFYNVAMCDRDYKHVNPPMVIDL